MATWTTVGIFLVFLNYRPLCSLKQDILDTDHLSSIHVNRLSLLGEDTEPIHNRFRRAADDSCQSGPATAPPSFNIEVELVFIIASILD